ncbi:hypothetical protein B9W64_37290 [Streptomyces sp. CS159]|uniref:hypothetical protein n=1 Tax=Streptomyces sp. CS159 TaxID=1982762 RepID=UPI000B420212|nr:hypothetical protein [Streptomyces sp. CS159]OVZ99453.1 hypothetical protein B9W64_37290 [Streptomyces sp. CS159]
MIIKSSLSDARTMDLPPLRSGSIRIASIDVEWTKNYHIKNGQRPFCYSVAWLDLPASGTADLSQVPFEWASFYVDEPDEMPHLVRHAAACVANSARTATIITGHQFCADLSVLEANAPQDAVSLLQSAREQWRQRRDADPSASHYVDTRYDAGHLLTGTSRRLVDVCTELGFDVTQPELLKKSMPAWHRLWVEDGEPEGRERVSVLNLRHSVSTAYVAALTAGLARRPDTGLNVNRAIAEGAKGAWGWLETPTFTALLEDSCPSATAALSPSKAPKRPARRRTSTR